MLRNFSIPDPGSQRFRIRINVFLTPKKLSRKYDPGCSSRILIFLPIPDPEGQKGTVSRIRIRNTDTKTSAGGGSEAWRQDVRELPRVPPGRPLGAGADHRAPRAGNSRHQVANTCRRPRVKKVDIELS
jgi:hypothetical protein